MISLLSEVEQRLMLNERYIAKSLDYIASKDSSWYTMIIYKYRRSMFSLPGQVRVFLGCTIFEKLDNEFIQVMAASSPLERMNERDSYTHLLRGYGSRQDYPAIAFICGIVENPKVLGVQVEFPNSGILQDSIENQAFGVAAYNDKVINRLTILGINDSVIDEINIGDDISPTIC